MLMKIENFVAKSKGSWRSMRSSHSLAFKYFEEVISKIDIEPLNCLDSAVLELLKNKNYLSKKHIAPFKVNWESKSDWESLDNDNVSQGFNILIPIPKNENKGEMIRSSGYAENIESVSEYTFLADDTFILHSSYNQTYVEERIWFASKNVRCRSSIIKSLDRESIIQTSFASEVRIIKSSS